MPKVTFAACQDCDERFCGKWYVVASTLDFWRTRGNGSITYSLLPRAPSGKQQLKDEVCYTSRSFIGKNSSSSVVGVDEQLQEHVGEFAWRGAGFPLKLLHSEWRVVGHDDGFAEWAVTWFSSTVFTKEGMDIYCRSPHPSPELITRLREAVRFVPQFSHFADAFFCVTHDPAP
eukprot:TRINITY_DN4842_c0_g2_i1.p1 TRINITY_DN4842_c0_g2~~TRINITY_DN4842_c0_g2_i1.p1  ORF type:complete len:188 (-),score=20.33 TRINITY_DN4842_c0_g2_i1:15-536(-)